MAYIQYGRNILRQIAKDANFHRYDRVMHPLLSVGQGLRFRKLEVILTTNMDNLGKAGETVRVAPGYFRNYLMPKLLAVPNIEKYANLMKQHKTYQPVEEEEVKVVEETEEDKMNEYQSAAKRLENAQLVLRKFYKVDKELRSPVTKDELVAEVARQLCVSIEPENLHLPSSLTSLGEFEVPLRLPRDLPLPEGKVQWTLKVKIRRK